MTRPAAYGGYSYLCLWFRGYGSKTCMSWFYSYCASVLVGKWCVGKSLYVVPYCSPSSDGDHFSLSTPLQNLPYGRGLPYRIASLGQMSRLFQLSAYTPERVSVPVEVPYQTDYLLFLIVLYQNSGGGKIIAIGNIPSCFLITRPLVS